VKRFQFAYATLLRVKRLREKLAESRVALARRQRDGCQHRLTALHEELGGVARRLELSLGVALQGPAWAGAFEQSARLERAIRDAEGQLAAAEEALRQAIEARTRLAAEVEMLETLEQQKRAEHRQEAQKAEQERLDELGMRRWREAQRPAEE
jgi:flagellar export protein FliJ